MANTLLKPEQRLKIQQHVDSLVAGGVMESCSQWGVIHRILENEKIELKESALKDISGILLKNDGRTWTIIINQEDSPTRKLFTIAHELGHYFLHKEERTQFVDGQLQNYWARDEETKFQWHEIEANEFAANLIMPSAAVKIEIDKLNAKTIGEKEVVSLAIKFGVSPLAMLTRLRNLDYAI